MCTERKVVAKEAAAGERGNEKKNAVQSQGHTFACLSAGNGLTL